MIKNITIFVFLLSLSSLSLGDELEDRKEISNNVKELLSHNSFSELESISIKYRNSQERTSSGLWKLTLFYAGFDEFYSHQQNDEKAWLDSIKKMDLWISIYPRSPTPYIAKAILIEKRAWTIRGTGYASTVSPDAWKPFHEKITLSKRVLESSKLISSKDPHWYASMANIATIQSWEEIKLKKLLNEGFSKFPSYFQMYFNAMDYYTPKWRGDANKIESFATEIVDKTKAKEGFGMYARIYWYASQSQFQGQLFEKSNVRWDIMSQGIDDVLKKYPDQWNINNFALFSCLAQDKEKTRELISMIKYPAIKTAWLEDLRIYEHCKIWSMR